MNLIAAGGPPKDGIPGLDHPEIVPLNEAEGLEPDDRVVGVRIGGEMRVYPMRILNWHEIVNDTLGERPIAVIYCPLCDSVSVVDRRVDDGTELEFGVSGLLLNSNVLMFDRTHDALWTQVGFTALSGPYAGQSLTHIDGWRITTVEKWRQEHPNSTIVSFNTGHSRDYEREPYGTPDPGRPPRFPLVSEDDRLPTYTRVVGIQIGEVVRAYPLAAIASRPGGRLIDESLPGGRLVLHSDGAAEAAIVEHPEGANVVHTYWFAWAAFHPETQIVSEVDR